MKVAIYTGEKEHMLHRIVRAFVRDSNDYADSFSDFIYLDSNGETNSDLLTGTCC